MDGPEDAHKRHEAFVRLFQEGGPRLDAYLREQAVETIEDTYYEADVATRQLAEAIHEGRKRGLSWAEIAALIESTPDEVQRIFGQ